MGFVGATVVGLLLVAGLTCAGLAAIAWRRRRRPGALPLAGLLVAVAVWTIGYGIGLLAHDPTHHRFWVAIQWFGLPFFPLFWLLFALEYAGYGEYVTSKTAGAFAVVPAVSMAMAHTNAVHGLMWSEYTINVVAGLAFLTYEFEPWFLLHAVYGYGLVLAGMLVLVRLIVGYDALYADQALSLAVGIVVPWIGNALVLARLVPFEGLDYTPFAFAVTGIAVSNALFRHQLLEFLPGVRLIGREAALEGLESGVLVVDDDRRVVYANPEAGAILVRSVDELPGSPIRELIDVNGIDFNDPDSHGQHSRAGRSYELRCSEITDRHGRSVGHTLVLTDVTDRNRRERRLRRQRDELAVVDALNGVVREITDLLAESPSREDVEHRTCERLVDSGLYTDARIGRDMVADGGEPTWTTGDRMDREGDENEGSLPDIAASVEAAGVDSVPEGDDETVTGPDGEDPPDPGGADGEWTSVPVVHGRVVYGALVVRTDRSDAFGERERDGLAELGQRLGHAIDAVENRALLVGDGYIELELGCTDERSALVALAAVEDCRGRLARFVPRREGRFLAYVRLDAGEPDAGTGATEPEADAAAGISETVGAFPGIVAVRVVGDRLLEIVLDERSLAAPIVDAGARVRTVDLEDGGCRVIAEAAPGTDVRSLVEAVQEIYPDTRLRRKARRDRLPDEIALPTALEGLTDRQREALEIAYQAGYFEWPRESTGEDVAAALSISPPTLHAHLRKAQNALVAELFEETLEPDLDAGGSRSSEEIDGVGRIDGVDEGDGAG